MKQLQRDGLAILFITHRIDDIYDFADNVSPGILSAPQIGSGDLVRDACSLSEAETSPGVLFAAAQGTHHVHVTTTGFF